MSALTAQRLLHIVYNIVTNRKDTYFPCVFQEKKAAARKNFLLAAPISLSVYKASKACRLLVVLDIAANIIPICNISIEGNRLQDWVSIHVITTAEADSICVAVSWLEVCSERYIKSL